MNPSTRHPGSNSRKAFSISLRLKAMASTLVVVVCVTALVGWKTQGIAWDQAVTSHERQIRYQLAQLSSRQYIEAFRRPAANGSDPREESPQGESPRARALKELSESIKEMVGDTFGNHSDSDGRQGVVFAAAFDVAGNVIAYARSPGYRGELYQDLVDYGRTLESGAAKEFSPLDDGRLPRIETRPVEQRVTSEVTGQAGLKRERITVGRVLIGHTLAPMEEDFALVQRKIWSWIAGIGVIATVLTWLASHTIVQPIYELIRGTERVAKGDYAHSVTVKSHDELAQLADSFNFMRGELRHTLQELDRQNRNLENIVRQRTRKLRAAYEELQTLDKMKDGFLSSISHEFRTPITSIKAFIEILTEDKEALHPAHEEFLGIIKAEADRLGGLVNDVLDLVKIENGEMPFSFSETSPSQPLRSAIEAQRERIADRDIQLDVEAAPELPMVCWDSAKITRVVHELLGNAIRFSEPGGAVHLSVALNDDGEVEFRVRDHGPGIPPQALEEVFKKFRQMGEVLTGKPTGTGLGLPICRQITQRHGGTLHAETPDGPGALLILRLPLEPPSTPAPSSPIVTEADMDVVFV